MTSRTLRSTTSGRGRSTRARALRRSLTVGAVATAVVAGSTTGVLAAPYSAPTAEVANSWLLAPVLRGEATSPGSGSQSIRFSARTVGATSWNLLNAVSVSGTEAYKALPTGRLGIADSFEYQVAHCDSSGCTSTPVQTGKVSSALGAGERPGATRLPLTIGDRIGGQIDVGSGNLLITPTLFSLQRRSGAPLEVGLAYNSTTRRDGYFPNSVGDEGSGWRLSTASDERLRPVNGSLGIAWIGRDSSQRLGRHRWVVERTLGWLLSYKRLALRYDRSASTITALARLAVTLICARRLWTN